MKKIGIIHEIHDVEAFQERSQEMMGEIPAGMETHQFCPSTDGEVATCVWEGDSLDHVRKFLDPQLGDASDQEYFEIDEETGAGIPG